MEDLITGAQAVLEPGLADVAPDDPRLLQLITVASMQVQRFIGYEYSAAEIEAGIGADIEYATAMYVAILWSYDSNQAKDGNGSLASENLGDYSYTRGTKELRGTRIGRVISLLLPFCGGHGATVIPAKEWHEDETLEPTF